LPLLVSREKPAPPDCPRAGGLLIDDDGHQLILGAPDEDDPRAGLGWWVRRRCHVILLASAGLATLCWALGCAMIDESLLQKEGTMTMYAPLTVRKLKPGTYDEWRKAWGGDEDMPEGVEAYILRNVKDPDEIIAFGLIEGDPEQLRAMIDPEEERKRQEAMAPYIESIGADGIYEVIERVGSKAGSRP
jgi:hypothetical protein